MYIPKSSNRKMGKSYKDRRHKMELVNHIKRFFYMFYTQHTAIIDIFHKGRLSCFFYCSPLKSFVNLSLSFVLSWSLLHYTRVRYTNILRIALLRFELKSVCMNWETLEGSEGQSGVLQSMGSQSQTRLSDRPTTTLCSGINP